MTSLENSKDFSFLTRKSLLLPVLVLFLILLTVSLFKNNPNSSDISFMIETPKEGAVLNYKQIFKIKVKEPKDFENVNFYWSVENSEQENRMQRVNDETFVDHVNVDEWDWDRNYQYIIKFFAKDLSGTVLSERAVKISTRPPPVVTELLLEEKDKPSDSDLKASAVSVAKEPVPLEQEESLPSDVLSIDVSKMVHGDHTYRFVFKSETHDYESIMAFWKSEGGHNNLISERNDNGQYQVNIDFSNWRWLDRGPYKVVFFVLDRESKEEIARATFSIFWEGDDDNRSLSFELEEQIIKTEIVSITPTGSLQVTNEEELAVLEEVTQIAPSNFQSERFVFSNFYNPQKPEVRNSFETANDPLKREALKYIMDHPWAVWLNNNEYESDDYLRGIMNEAEAKQVIPVFVLYNIPNRDCGSYSLGGADSAIKYREWVDRLTTVLNSTEAIFIIEPDALPQLNCLSGERRDERLDLIRYAVESLAELPLAHVYIDAGHPFWINPEEMAERLKAVNISVASGFALNVSNFTSTEDNIRYGDYLSFLTENSYYVIDTSRNGNGPASDYDWCNPPGRALGEVSRLVEERKALSAFLWIKCPGESDGTCNGGPAAGHWWEDYAVELGKNFLRSN